MSFLVSLFVVISSLISTPSHAATEVFRMYDQPNPEVSTFCNRFTKLQLNLNGNSGTATISNHLEGFCEIYVQENKKTVKITLKEVSCGSKIYKNLDSSQAQIEIVDNRTRVCEDVIPALIVLKQLGRDGQVYPSYSLDRQ